MNEYILILKGASNPKGFKLVNCITKKRVYSRGYKKSLQYLMPRISLSFFIPYLIYQLVGLVLVILRYVNWRIFDFSVWISPWIYTATCGVTCMFFLVYFAGRKDLSQWHAVEHKLAYYLKNNRDRELTIEELKKCPSISESCGSRNKDLIEPSLEKLKEAVAVGKEFLSKF